MAASTAKKKSEKSGSPAKKATVAGKWKRQKGEELELPSGNVALVKRPGPQALLSEGILPDTLMPIVQQAISKGKGIKPQDIDMKDPKVITDMLGAMDKLLLKVVVEPKVAYDKCLKPMDMGGVTPGPALEEWVDIPDDIRDGESTCPNCGEVHADSNEVIYVDEVDLDDKMFVFNYAVGGTRDLERFRSEQSARLGDLSDGAGDADSTE